MPGRSGFDPKISNDAVRDATGRTWKQWFALLDRVGSENKNHKQIVAYLQANYPRNSFWWQQSITVAYEQARGLRDLHEKPGGYEISVSRTIATDVDTLFKACKDKRTRNRWLTEDLTVRKSSPGKSLRITWDEDGTSLNFNFYARGDSKSQVVVQHTKLPDSASAVLRKEFWSERLDNLKAILSKKS